MGWVWVFYFYFIFSLVLFFLWRGRGGQSYSEASLQIFKIGKIGKNGILENFLLLGSMMKILFKEIPDHEFVRKHGEESPELYTITLKEQFNEEQICNLSLKLQLNGAACVFYGNKEDRYLGLVLWAVALKLKEDHTIPEIPRIDLTPSQKLVFKQKKQIKYIEDIPKLMKQRRKHWQNISLRFVSFFEFLHKGVLQK